MSGPMLFTDTFSILGRSTAGDLENLRRQLGVGIDPAYDYSQMEEIQRKLTAKKEKKSKDDVASGGALDQLRQAIKEATTQPPAEEAEEAEAADGALGKPGASAHGRGLARGAQKPSYAFRVRDRNSLAALDVANRFRAPPVGTYRAKYDLADPRVKGQHDFKLREPTKSRSLTALENEVAKLQEEGQPWEHLVKPAVSVELLDEKPQTLKPRLNNYNMSKDVARPDIVKAAGIVWHDNSFTAGVLDGDKNTSKSSKPVVHDFAKMSGAGSKVKETFFQPGQYNVNVGFTRPKMEVKNIPFALQTKRKPLRETIGRVEIKSRMGDHLPDRSLARSCPLLSGVPRVKGTDFDKYTDRPPPAKPIKPYHDAEDPEIDRDVFHREMTHDEMEVAKASWTKPRTVEKFERSLKRSEHFKIQRSYGEDLPRKLARENLANGPTSVELLPMDAVGRSEQLQPRILVRDFQTMAERGSPQRKYAVSPSRNKDQGDAVKFERSVRLGDARPATEVMSPMAGEISRLRSTRGFAGMVVRE